MQPAPPTSSDVASSPLDLIEIFSSVQGEGIHVGRRQIFIRLAGCNLDCAYCDTPTRSLPTCSVEDRPGSGRRLSIPNPVPPETIVRIVGSWVVNAPALHHSLSITGGEPLMQGDRLHALISRLAEILPVHLETNGTLPDLLEPLLPHLSLVSMDLKLPSSTGSAPRWELHERFLRAAASRPVSVKIVVNAWTSRNEIVTASRLVSRIDPSIPLILQPETTPSPQKRIDGRTLLDLQETAAAILHDVRVIPQTHPLLGVA